MKIKILADNLINQIAAGEVIERPASVVKECVENSVDAGATQVIIELEEGGISLIRITDDGCGIVREDAEMAFARHATSKISTQEDLNTINSMGFRGEALASIASVSLCKLLTKTAREQAGTEVVLEGGDLKNLRDAAFQTGTQLEVRNLFYNTPARRKYLKSVATEYKYIAGFATQFALSKPEIGIQLIHNGQTTLELPPADDKVRIEQLFGRETANNLLAVNYHATHFKVHGFIGKPIIARKSKNQQFIFVNGRLIVNNSLSYAVKEAFTSLLPNERYPFFVLHLEVDPQFVDVNVHPRKLEVRFLNPAEAFQIIKTACKKAVEENILFPQILPQADFPSGNQGADFFQEKFSRENFSTQPMILSDNVVNYGNYEKFAYSPQNSPAHQGLNASPQNNIGIKPIAQINHSYIVAESAEGIILIDQHAAHERVLYEKFSQNFGDAKIEQQPLLAPLSLDLSHVEALTLKENLPLFTDLGLDIESFGGDTFVIQAAPNYLIKDDLSKVVKSVLDDLQDGKTIKKALGKKEALLASMACRSAVMFGDKLSMDEMYALVKEWEKTTNRYTCPHGRPCLFVLSFDELEKKFGRRGLM